MSQASRPAKHRAEVPDGARSPQDLEAEVEATRLRLADSLDQLTYRVKPKTIIDRKIEETKAKFTDGNGKLRQDKVARIAGVTVGVVALFVVVRKLTHAKG